MKASFNRNQNYKNLREVRENAGLSAAYVALILGKNKSTVYSWESDDRPVIPNLTPKETSLLLQLYSITLEQLVSLTTFDE